MAEQEHKVIDGAAKENLAAHRPPYQLSSLLDNPLATQHINQVGAGGFATETAAEG